MCKVDKVTRNNCRRCRMERFHNRLSLSATSFFFLRCLQYGMKPELVNSTVKRAAQKGSNASEAPRHSITSEVLGNKRDSEVLMSQVSSEVVENVQSNDIEKLVELCYKEEQDSLNQAIDKSPTTGTLLPFKKRRTDHYNEVSIQICDQPLMPFTVEEEYRLHDLIVKREYFNEQSHSSMLEVDPVMVQNAEERMLADMNDNKKITFDEDYLDFFFNISSRIGTI